ncbi:uncharacterized protein C2845_PM02G35830 [Panicum miliaceum]|uniref:Uncharacterized protein n=1 Tax=Panicum miliaceum TaxID=4540 RepID=A0A3L6S971_PANMI|nr:uncharacterized protein C2845_PM02G35830 [Panicum miliaceum]
MGRSTSTEKLVCVVVAVLAVLSPLYIDRRPAAESEDEEEDGGGSALWLPALLVVLILAINVTCFMDRRVVRFDPYWIHRVWGSSGGLMAMLLLLGFVLKSCSYLDRRHGGLARFGFFFRRMRQVQKEHYYEILDVSKNAV